MPQFVILCQGWKKCRLALWTLSKGVGHPKEAWYFQIKNTLLLWQIKKESTICNSQMHYVI